MADTLTFPVTYSFLIKIFPSSKALQDLDRDGEIVSLILKKQ